MRRVIIFFIVFFAAASADARPSVEEQYQWAIRGRDLLLARRYEEAEDFLKKLVTDWPQELLGYFGLMALTQVRNLENFDFRFDPSYKEWEETGRRMALRITRDREAGSWDLLIAGGTLGVSGFYRAHNSKWFPGLRDASTAFHTFEKCLKKDPRMVDALLGIGLYDYWRSHFTRRLRFLPFFPDRREEARARLARAMTEAHFASVLAEIALAFIDFQEKKYGSVLETTGRLLRKYPQNTIFRMLQGETLLSMKKYGAAVKEFETIRSVEPAITKPLLFMGLAYVREGKQVDKAKELLQKFLELEPSAPSHWRRPALERLKELEKKASQS